MYRIEILKDYLGKIQDTGQKARMVELFQWVYNTFPNLEEVIKWNQPMFIDHGTFIIGFSMAKYHMSFTPEESVITQFLEDIVKSGYDHTKGLVKIKWTDEIDYSLIKRIVEFYFVFHLYEKYTCKIFVAFYTIIA